MFQAVSLTPPEFLEIPSLQVRLRVPSCIVVHLGIPRFYTPFHTSNNVNRDPSYIQRMHISISLVVGFVGDMSLVGIYLRNTA